MSALKYPIFFLFLFIGVPVIGIFASKYKTIRNLIFFAALFFTCNMIDINFISMETYRGTSKGFEFGMVDMAAMILLLQVFVDRKRYRICWLPPGSFLYFMYFALSTLSIINSDVLMYSAFEIFKMVRVYVFFWTMYNIIVSPEIVTRIVKYISIIVLFIFIVVLKQKYIDHLFQCQGPFPHQNSLVMYMCVFMCIIFSHLLGIGSIKKMTYWLFVLGAASVSLIATLSRAGMAVGVLGLAVVLSLHLGWKLNPRKIIIVLIMVIAGSGILLKSIDTITERFTTAPEESKTVRIELAQAAVKMANDKLFGIGLNNFAHKINPPYSYSSHIEMEDDDKGGLVETIYLMIAAETGWHNLVVFLIMLLYFYIRNIINIFRSALPQCRAVSIGIAGGLTAVYAESTLEWVLKQTNNFYQLFFVFALIGAISRINKNHKIAKALK